MSQVLYQKSRNWHVTEPLFHRVEELYIVAPDLAYIPPLAREFNDATYLTSPPEPFLGYKPSAHRLSHFQGLLPLCRPSQHRTNRPSIVLGSRPPYLYGPLCVLSGNIFKPLFQGSDAWRFTLPRANSPKLSGITQKLEEGPKESECHELLNIVVNVPLDERYLLPSSHVPYRRGAGVVL